MYSSKDHVVGVLFFLVSGSKDEDDDDDDDDDVQDTICLFFLSHGHQYVHCLISDISIVELLQSSKYVLCVLPIQQLTSTQRM